VVALPSGAVTVPPPVYEPRWSLQRAFSVTPATVGSAVAVLALVGGGVWLLLRRGRDRRYVGEIPGLAPVAGSAAAEEMRPFGDSGEGPVEWSPPDGLRPGLLGTLIDEQANVLDVTATIVDLAVRGYLRIDEIPDQGLFSSRDWQLVQLKGGDTELLDYEQKLFAALFTGRHVVRLSELKQHFADDLQRVQSSLYDELVYRKWYRRRPDSTRTAWGFFGLLAVAAAAGITYLLARYTTFGLVGVALVVGAGVLWLVGRDMPARTGSGSAVLARTLGFRRYLATADPVRGGHRRLLAVLALRHRVRRGRSVGQGVRLAGRSGRSSRDAGRPLVHERSRLQLCELRQLGERVLGEHLRLDLGRCGQLEERVQRRRRLFGRWLRWRGRWRVVTRPKGAE
jgi:hypothetical protein